MKRVILGLIVLAILAIPASANPVKEQITLFTMIANTQLTDAKNITEMNLNFSYYQDLNGDGIDDVVSTSIHIGKTIESKIRIANSSFTYNGIAIAYPINDINNDGLKDVLLNKIFSVNKSSEVAIYSKNGLLWDYSQKQAIMIAIPDNKNVIVSQIMMDFMYPSTEVIKFNNEGNATMKYVMSGLGYALPLDDVNSDGVKDILITKLVDLLPNGYSVSGAFIVDGATGKTLSRFLETYEKGVSTAIGLAVNDLDGDGVKDIILQLLEQKRNSTDVLLKVISSKKAVESQSFNDGLLWQKKFKNFVGVTVVKDTDGDGLQDIGVISYKFVYPTPNIVYPTNVQNIEYEFDIFRGYDGKLLAHYEAKSR